MSSVPLTPATEQRLQLLFPPEDRERVRTALLDECGENIPGRQVAGLERLRCAVLKISDGEFLKLYQALDSAKTDLRDMLMWAGCGGVDAHLNWLPERKWHPRGN